MTNWARMKVADLKAELERRGLPSVGKKAVLVAALHDHDLVNQPAQPSQLAQPNQETDPTPVSSSALVNYKGILSVLQNRCRNPDDFPDLKAKLLSAIEEYIDDLDALQTIRELLGEESERVADALDIPDRKDREQYIKLLIADYHGVREGPAIVWAAYHLMPLERLEEATRPLGMPGVARGGLHKLLKDDGTDVVKKWLARSRKSSISCFTTPASSDIEDIEDIEDIPNNPSLKRAAPSLLQKVTKKRRIASEPLDQAPAPTSTPGPEGRSKDAKDICRWRDHDRCVVTSWPDPDVAHIFPFSMRGKADSKFWGLLDTIWPSDKVAAWKQAVGVDGSSTEKCSNLICLTPTLHRWWGQAKFALKPISVTGNELRLQFFWLKKVGCGPTQVMPLLTKPEDALVEQVWQPGSKPWESGTMFTIKASTPDLLPSFEILEMQWHLQRLAAMSGAADVDMEDSDDDDLESPVRGQVWLPQEGYDYGNSMADLIPDSKANTVY